MPKKKTAQVFSLFRAILLFVCTLFILAYFYENLFPQKHNLDVNVVDTNTNSALILSYNVHLGLDYLTVSEHRARLAPIAAMIKEKGVVMAGLQEMNYKAFANGETGDDMQIIQEELQKIGYPMYAVADPKTPTEKGYFRNVILSVYPIDTNSVQSIPLQTGESGRTILIANIPNTKIGNIKFIATHLRQGCDGALEFKTKMQSLLTANSIVTGDFNHVSVGDAGVFGNEATCPIGLDSVYQYTCSSLPCFMSTTIDYTLVKKDGDLFIDTRWKENINYSDHLPVFSTIKSKVVVPPVTPPPVTITPTPVITPNPVNTDLIKVGSYNILNTNDGSGILKKIAEYIKNQNIEIIGIQELSTVTNAASILEQEFKNVGYPMYMAVSPQKAEKYFENAVYSKYPIIDAKYIGQNPCSSTTGVCTRWAVIAQISAPQKTLRFVSTHIHHGTDNCQSLQQFYDIINSYFSEPLVIAGDFNAELNYCSNFLQNAFSYTCEDTNNCVNKSINWIFLSKFNNLLTQVSRTADASNTYSDHKPLSSIIRVNKVTFPGVKSLSAQINLEGRTNDNTYNPVAIVLLRPAENKILASALASSSLDGTLSTSANLVFTNNGSVFSLESSDKIIIKPKKYLSKSYTVGSLKISSDKITIEDNSSFIAGDAGAELSDFDRISIADLLFIIRKYVQNSFDVSLDYIKDGKLLLNDALLFYKNLSKSGSLIGSDLNSDSIWSIYKLFY